MTKNSERCADRIKILYNLLDGCPVLLPIPIRKKGPRIRAWQQITWEASQAIAYQKKLRTHGNTGVLLGQPSCGLCSIDIDHDDEIEPFLQSNPALRDTLRTKGSRGENLWVKVTGDYPALKKLVRDGTEWGEWRADGGQTVIAGTHPTGQLYRIVNEARPVPIHYTEIVWLPGIEPPSPTGASAHTPPTALSASSVSLHNSADSTPSALLHNKAKNLTTSRQDATLSAIRAHKAFQKKHPSLAALYARWIENVYTPKQGLRNTNLIEMVTFLAHCVGPEQVLQLTAHFYDRSAPVWTDSREQHLIEAHSHLGRVLADFRQKLPPGEREIYDELEAPEQTAFRVCRDLASIENPRCAEGTFFLSCDDLASRLGCYAMQAHRILKNFQNLAILEIAEPGLQRKAGQKPKATTYRWLYSLRQQALMPDQA